MAQQGINPKQIKSYNDSALLYLLSTEGKLSRKVIASRLELTAAAVSKITKRLIENGKIEEIGISSENGDRVGRKEVLLSLKSADKICLGINVELDMVTYSASDVSGKLIDKKSYAFFDDIEEIVDRAKAFIAAAGQPIERYIGIGLCVVGSVKKNSFGVWDNAAVSEALKSALGLPVATENNVKAFALAEMIFSDDIPDNNTVLFFKWGMGIGSAVAVGGKLLSSNDYSLTEIGHYIVDRSGVKCRCGRYGCLETVASASVLSKEAGGMSLEDIVNSENEDVISMLDTKIDVVALALTNTATILNAKRIVLFGTVFENEKIVEKLVRQCARYNNKFKENRMFVGLLSDESTYIGAAAVCAQKFFFSSEE